MVLVSQAVTHKNTRASVISLNHVCLYLLFSNMLTGIETLIDILKKVTVFRVTEILKKVFRVISDTFDTLEICSTVEPSF